VSDGFEEYVAEYAPAFIKFVKIKKRFRVHRRHLTGRGGVAERGPEWKNGGSNPRSPTATETQ
jgi:hypothetical protein